MFLHEEWQREWESESNMIVASDLGNIINNLMFLHEEWQREWESESNMNKLKNCQKLNENHTPKGMMR